MGRTPLTFRMLAQDMAAHINAPGGIDGPLPVGTLPYMQNVINASLELMLQEAPKMFQRPFGGVWGNQNGGTVTGTVNVTQNSQVMTLGTLATAVNGGPPPDGCTINIPGDQYYNEMQADGNGDGSYQLLIPCQAATGTVGATVWLDSVVMPGTVDHIIDAAFLHESRQLVILDSKQEWLLRQGNAFLGDYGFRLASPTVWRTPGVPMGVWIQNAVDPLGGQILYRARCTPMPNGYYPFEMTVQTIPSNITAAAAFGTPAVSSVAVTAAGSGYTSPPTVIFQGGLGATGTAVLGSGGTAGQVVSVTVTAGGYGFSASIMNGSVTLQGGGGTGATATFATTAGAYDPGITTATPGQRDYSILRAIALYQWCESPWWRGTKELADRLKASYDNAVNTLNHFKGNSSSIGRMVVLGATGQSVYGDGYGQYSGY